MKWYELKEEKIDLEDAKDNKYDAILAYIPLLALIPYFSKTDSKFVEFHAKQGMTLLVFEILYMVVYIIFSQIRVTECSWGTCEKFLPIYIAIPINVILTLILFLNVIGIINIFECKARTLPLIGRLDLFK